MKVHRAYQSHKRVSVPIYEYYCEACHGRFSHLARHLDDPTPPCPRCGNVSVERLISASNVIRGAVYHETQLRDSASQVDRQDPKAAAGFLRESGRLQDASGLYGSQAYRELISRRMEGATDADLGDLVDDLVAAADVTPAAELAGMVALSKQVENRMGAEGPPQGHEHGAGMTSSAEDAGGSETQPGRVQSRSRRSAKNLGWG